MKILLKEDFEPEKGILWKAGSTVDAYPPYAHKAISEGKADEVLPPKTGLFKRKKTK